MLQGLTLGIPHGLEVCPAGSHACAASPAAVPHPPYTPCPGAPERDSWASWALRVRERSSGAGTVRGGVVGQRRVPKDPDPRGPRTGLSWAVSPEKGRQGRTGTDDPCSLFSGRDPVLMESRQPLRCQAGRGPRQVSLRTRPSQSHPRAATSSGVWPRARGCGHELGGVATS